MQTSNHIYWYYIFINIYSIYLVKVLLMNRRADLNTVAYSTRVSVTKNAFLSAPDVVLVEIFLMHLPLALLHLEPQYFFGQKLTEPKKKIYLFEVFPLCCSQVVCVNVLYIFSFHFYFCRSFTWIPWSCMISYGFIWYPSFGLIMSYHFIHNAWF